MRAVGRIQIYIYPCATISAVEISGYASLLCALETMTFHKAIAALLLTAALAGCQSQTEGQQRATTGALIGGAGGALVGQAIGGNTKSTVIGAASGALLGAVVGSATTPQRRGEEMCRYQDRYGRIYTAPCDDRYYNGNY